MMRGQQHVKMRGTWISCWILAYGPWNVVFNKPPQYQLSKNVFLFQFPRFCPDEYWSSGLPCLNFRLILLPDLQLTAGTGVWIDFIRIQSQFPNIRAETLCEIKIVSIRT